MDLLTLNHEQQQAVLHITTPLSIRAGPGTGKTKTLTTKIAYLITHHNIPPQKILALTFTKKAANEMRERVQTLLTLNQQTLPFIGTFHALCFELLKRQNKDLKIISTEQQTELLEQLRVENKELKKITLKNALLEIAQWKSSRQKTDPPHIVKKYNQKLLEKNLLDYDDLLLKTRINQSESPAPITYEYILVDEFQDTNQLQYELIKTFLGPHKNLTVIGDPLQSIYSFRGADNEIFDKIKTEYPDTKEINLKTNYRSATEILEISTQLFPTAPHLEPSTTKTGNVHLLETFNEATEADWILEDIEKSIGGLDLIKAGRYKNDTTEPLKFADFAIIYRTHSIKKALEDKLTDHGIPYQIIGSKTLYEESYIKKIIQNLKSLDETKTKKLSEYAGEIITNLNLNTLTTTQNQLKNINQLMSTLIRFDNNPNGLKDFLAYLTYLEQNEFYDPQADKITLLTIHASKGLEFKNVYIIGCEDGLIPYIKKYEAEEEPNIEEEKRLLYVAMTRAKQNLTLIQTKTRTKQKTTTSRFLKDINTPPLTKIIDERIQKIETKIKKEKAKKSQLSLF